MNRFLPHPLLVVCLILMWLLLTRFTPGHLLLGTAVALVAGWAMGSLQPVLPRPQPRPQPRLRPRLRRWDLLALLAVTVGWDIIRCNAALAGLLLTGGRSGRKSGFLRVPLDLRDPAGLALLAIIITATPGTAWLEHDQPSGVLLLHVFDLRDENVSRDLIRTRYEAPLLRIFG